MVINRIIITVTEISTSCLNKYVLRYFLKIDQFLTFQGYELQYTIGKITVHSILTEDIRVLKGA